MDKRVRKSKSGLSKKKQLAELLADAAKAKTAYKWDQAIEMYTQALVLVDEISNETPDQTPADRLLCLTERFEILDQRRIC